MANYWLLLMDDYLDQEGKWVSQPKLRILGKQSLFAKWIMRKNMGILPTNVSITVEHWQYCRWLENNAPLLLRYTAIRLTKY